MAKLLPHCIISIGEDAVCKVWSYSGTNLHSLKGHKGKSIWSMAVDRENKTVVNSYSSDLYAAGCVRVCATLYLLSGNRWR